jgi:hypothetical protein
LKKIRGIELRFVAGPGNLVGGYWKISGAGVGPELYRRKSSIGLPAVRVEMWLKGAATWGWEWGKGKSE